ncbi:hypothetical protein MEQU1_001488 [Malassezia equina]|uniref:Uncharacterized protein n=1 Tax=Malassezia equina TaxID=1381935 RepID=A0AAF0EDU0_9BASI|nr:hypothetical protein MEQU1_001488 [Malassezia equina]
MERAEVRKIGRLPVLGAHARTPPRSAERSLRLSLDETLGESPLMTGLHDMDLPPPVLPGSPLARHADVDDDDDDEEEDADFVPEEQDAPDASSSDMDEEPVWDEPEPAPRRPMAHTPAQEGPTRRTPQSQREQTVSKTPTASAEPTAEAAGYYDTIDFDKITDPFTDTRRAFMRGKAQAPPPPRPEAVSSPALPSAPIAGPSRMTPRRPMPEPAKAATVQRASPVKAITPLPAKSTTPRPVSLAKGATPVRTLPVKARTPLRASAPDERSRSAITHKEGVPASPVPTSPWSAPRAAQPSTAAPRPRPSAAVTPPAPSSGAQARGFEPDVPTQAPRRSVPMPRAPELGAGGVTASVIPAAPAVEAPARTEPAPTTAPPTRSNRLLTEELLKWKRRCAELEDELDTMQERLVHARGDAHDWTSEQAALQEQVALLQRGRESDRRAMRQRVRVLESHMADTKIEYDNRYWRLLTSSSDGAEEVDSVHVQLVIHQNQVTTLQSELAEQRRRLRLAHEQTAFLAGLYAHRGQQQATSQAEETQRLQQQVAELQAQVAAQAAARQAAEAALDAQRAPRRSSAGVASHPAATDVPMEAADVVPGALASPTLESHGVRPPPSVWTHEADTVPEEPAALSHAGEDEAPRTTTPVRKPARELRPGMTPMLERTAVATADLEAEATPMLGTRVRDDHAPQARKKKRRLIGSGQGFLRLTDGAEGLSPTLDVPADLPPLA